MTALLAFTAALAGACVGSYAATAAQRAARGEQSLSGRSACDGCGVRLGFARMTPVVSFAVARGVCHACGEPIARIHLVGEVVGALAAAAPFLLFPAGRAVWIATLGLLLLCAALVDAKTRRIPDVLTAGVALSGLALAAGASMATLPSRIAWALGVVLILQAVRVAFRRFREAEGLGFGDVKLLGALALWLGQAAPWALCLAAASGLAFALLRQPADNRIPFAPFIAVAAWLVGATYEVVA
ncbi:MAG TPA: A24 family peptidase [Caulobacteraceae bacterium]|nr:A24 family peptidase [Caulobacteraceae bacterium]